MATHNVNTLIYSSTCATYGEPEKMPITEETPQVPWSYMLHVISPFLHTHIMLCYLAYYLGFMLCIVEPN